MYVPTVRSLIEATELCQKALDEWEGRGHSDIPSSARPTYALLQRAKAAIERAEANLNAHLGD